MGLVPRESGNFGVGMTPGESKVVSPNRLRQSESTRDACAASERRGNNLQRFNDFYLKVKARSGNGPNPLNPQPPEQVPVSP